MRNVLMLFFLFFIAGIPQISAQQSAIYTNNLSEFDNAFKLFKESKMAMFFIFSMFLGAALQLTNMYGETYIKDFENIPKYAETFVVKSANIVLSISQISETIFILAIPFFLRRYGIKKVMLFSFLNPFDNNSHLRVPDSQVPAAATRLVHPIEH